MQHPVHALLLACTLLAAPALCAEAAHEGGARAICLRVADRLASVRRSDCDAPDLALTGGRSVNGLPIFARGYPPLAPRKPQGRVLLIGGIHGDELSSISIVFRWMRILDQHHSGLFHWNIVPALNPDGLLRRKALRTNANGVDLNRNFPSPNWQEEAIEGYWIKRTRSNPRRYPGPAPLSEPESRWLAGEIERFQPDVIVAVHAPYGVVDFDGPPHGPDHLGRLRLNLLGTYPGSLGNYAGVQMRIPVVTVELPYAGIMPSRNETTAMWMDLVRWLRENIPKKVRPLFAGRQAGPS